MKRWLMVWTLLLTLAVVLPHLALASAGGTLRNGHDQQIDSATSGGAPDVEFRPGESVKNKPWYQRAWDAAKDAGSHVGKSISGAWDWTSDKLHGAWNWAVDLAHSPGLPKGAIGGVIAVVVVVIVGVLVAAGGWVVAAAAAVAFLASLLFGALARESATIGASALVGIGAGLAVLASPAWLAGLRAMPLADLLGQGVMGGFLNGLAGLFWDGAQWLFTGKGPSASVAAMNFVWNFAGGFVAGLLLGPAHKGLESYPFRGIARGSVDWQWQTKFLKFASSASFYMALKGILDAAQKKKVTVGNLFKALIVGGLFSFLRFRLRVVEDLTNEGVKRGLDEATPGLPLPTEPPKSCIPLPHERRNSVEGSVAR
jgi:hypothetical protein